MNYAAVAVFRARGRRVGDNAVTTATAETLRTQSKSSAISPVSAVDRHQDKPGNG
jgi:hypothetical protein